MEPVLLWGFALLGAALLLFVVELFVPSGGVLGVVSGVLAVAGVIAFWRAGTWWGTSATLAVATLVPVGINFAIRVMPHTPFGRRLILKQESDVQMHAEDMQRREAEAMQAIVGATGTAVTPLRPIGVAEIEGQRVEVLAEGGPIDSGTPIRVVSITDNQLRVRAVTPEPRA